MAKMTSLRVEVVETPQGVLVRLTGEAGLVSVDTLQKWLTGLVARRPRLVVFDLAGLDFVTSLAMGVLVGFRRGVCRYGGEVKLAALRPLVLGAFLTAQLQELFPVTETVEEALGVRALACPA
jgi:anti-anti-sigma factor